MYARLVLPIILPPLLATHSTQEPLSSIVTGEIVQLINTPPSARSLVVHGKYLESSNAKPSVIPLSFVLHLNKAVVLKPTP